ncbi:DUF1573 domain-containing protein [Flaviaesturariibacter terrae]
MKAFFPVLAAAAIFAACNGQDAQSSSRADSLKRAQDTRTMTDTANYTKIQWLDSTTQELGKVMEGAQVEVVWRFRNSGNKPLVIEKAQPGCGCTIAEKPEAPVAPGAEGRIRATFNSEGRIGTQHKNVIVQANTNPNIQELYFNVEVTAQ